MKVEIKINWGVNVESGSETFDLEDVECETIEQWQDMNESEQWEALQNALDGLPARSFPLVDNFTTNII
ncbi:MAG: hypothetical protein ACUZ8E_07045 [Candidatus Anammoxibacter sp.]